METLSALLALCAGNSPVPGEFPTQRPVTRGFDVYFDMRPNKRLSKQSLGWWFETLSPPLWRHRNAARLKQFQSLPIGWHIINMFGEKIVTIVHFEGFSEEQSILTNSIIFAACKTSWTKHYKSMIIKSWDREIPFFFFTSRRFPWLSFKKRLRWGHVIQNYHCCYYW